MERPLDIAFHNLKATPEAEAEIRLQVEKLDKRYNRLNGCRVSVAQLHQHHQTGNLYEVHIILSVPGQELAVSHEPHHAKERRAHPDVIACIKDAFKMAERQLDAFKGQTHARAEAPNAQVAE